VIGTREAFGGQFLNLEATSPVGHEERPAVSADYGSSGCTSSFAVRFEEKLGFWRARLQELRSGGERTVVWGAGSKGVTFLNALEAAADVEYVVDINPRKADMHVAGTGQKIVPPEFLREYAPRVVLVMNPLYLVEIRQKLRLMGVESECLAV
jgi:hypothetical protein